MYKMLIVDDEPLTREYMRENLSLLHAEWEFAGEAGDGQEALELLDSGKTYDLIITDIKMPVMDGLELAREVSARKSRPRMVILSGYDDFSLAKEAMRYGVQEFLLKPIVKEELIAILNKISMQLVEERSESMAYQALVSLSKETKEQVTMNFLRAVVSDNHVEIKALYPILFRLKVGLIEAEGAIMILDLNEAQLLQRDISPSQLALFRYILHQTTTELSSMNVNRGTAVFFDGEQKTTVLVPGEDTSDVMNRCRQFFNHLSKVISDMTGISLWGAVGSSEMDVLQLNYSYRKANQTLRSRLFADKPSLFYFNPNDALNTLKVKQLDKSVAGIHSALSNNNEVNLTCALRSFVELMEPTDRRKLFQFGTFLINRLSGLLEGVEQVSLHEAFSFLKEQSGNIDCSAEEVLSLYRRMLEPLYLPTESESDGGGNEHEIVTKAKDYIYAHFAEPLSLALVAENACVSTNYLSNLFLKNNESYIKFLTRIRMEHAAMLLQSKPSEKVYDVAEKVGYVSVKHFSYVFKQYFGMPPGEYQDKSRGCSS